MAVIPISARVLAVEFGPGESGGVAMGDIAHEGVTIAVEMEMDSFAWACGRQQAPEPLGDPSGHLL